MAYNEKLAGKLREALAEVSHVEEKKMMGGLTFMVDEKMCVGVFKDELMCRIDPDTGEDVLAKKGCRIMELTGRGPMRGYVLINEEGMKTKKDFDYWINLSLDFNKRAKASKKRKVKVNE